MPLYRLKVWTGPTAPKAIGRKLRRAGLKTPVIGTEHVYVDIKVARQQDCIDAEQIMKSKLKNKYKRDLGLRAASCQLRK